MSDEHAPRPVPPPVCNQCGRPMTRVTVIPRVTKPGRLMLFECEACERTRIRLEPQSEVAGDPACKPLIQNRNGIIGRHVCDHVNQSTSTRQVSRKMIKHTILLHPMHAQVRNGRVRGLAPPTEVVASSATRLF
jgi:hypothetical protein